MGTKTSELVLSIRAVTTGFRRGLAAARGVFNKFTDRLKAGFRKVKAAAKALAVALGIIATAITGAAVSAAKFEESMAYVSTMVKNSKKFMGDFANGIKRMAVEFGQSTDSLAKALYDILSASVPPEQALMVLREASESAVAGFTDVGQVGKVLVSIMNAMGISFDQAGTVADVLFRTVERGQLTFRDLVPNLARAMVAARSSKVSFEEIAASYAFLTRKGFDAAQAETALAQALSKIETPTEGAIAAAQQYGLSIGEGVLASKGLLGVLEELSKAGLGTQAIADLFPEERAKRAILSMLNDMAGFRKDVEAMYKSGGAQARAYGKASETLSHKWAKFVQTMKVFMIEAIAPVLPALKRLFDSLGKIAEYVSGTLPGMQGQVQSFAMIVVRQIENFILFAMRAHVQATYVIQSIITWLGTLSEKMRVVLDYGIIRWFIESVFSAVSQFFSNIGRIIGNFLANLIMNVGEAATWIWRQLKSAFTGEKVPPPDFTNFLRGCEWVWENAYPDIVEKGFKKAEMLHKIRMKLLEEDHKGRMEALAKLEKSLNEKKDKDASALAEREQKIEYKWKREKIKAAKKSAKQLLEAEKDKLQHQKAMGELSAREEVARLHKLLSKTKKGSKERMELEEEIYEFEKNMRSERFRMAMEEIDYAKATNIQKLDAKVEFLSKVLKYENLSTSEQKELAKELYRLKMQLRASEAEDRKKRFEETKTWGMERVEGEINLLKKRIRMTRAGSDEESYYKQKLWNAQRRQMMHEWKWAERQFRRRKKLTSSEIKDRIAWLEQFATNEAMTEKERKKVLEQAAGWRKKLRERMKKEGKLSDEEIEKRMQEIGKQSDKKEKDSEERKQEQRKQNIEGLKSAAQAAAAGIQGALSAALDAVLAKIAAVKAALMSLGVVMGGNVFSGGMGVEGGSASINCVCQCKCTPLQNININLGSGAFAGANLNSMVDRNNAAQQISQDIGNAVGEFMRIPQGGV